MSELETFVLGYLKQVDSIVEPAVYGVNEVLLPETVAERWNTAVYQQLTFSETAATDVTRLGYNHPLVEKMVAEVRAQMASTRAYINDLRLTKTGLDSLAAQSWVILNGRVSSQPRAVLARVRSTYIQFNFKAAILSDEKQEQLVSVLLDAHSGFRAADTNIIEKRATAGTPDVLLKSLPDAPIIWQPATGKTVKTPLAQDTLEALLERAKTAILQEMATDLTGLQKRVGRFRELDEARLTDYYGEMERDLKDRLRRASSERRAGLVDKLEAVEAERAHKLADLAERYQVGLNLTLINLRIIQQAKLRMSVIVQNRTTKISAGAIWDPLLHRLEPLLCGVCGSPSERTYLCQNGHLAHADCLAPACIDCKRVFCQQCAHEVGTCDVCHEPLCRQSRIVCKECGRGTCQAHKGLCHANSGEPVDLTVQTPAPPEPKIDPSPPAAKKPPARPKRPQPIRKPKTAVTRPRMPKGVPRPIRMEVVLHHNAVAAFVLGSRERQIASRVWELDPADGGIICTCECEKGETCSANNMVARPSVWQSIEDQIAQYITKFREEYGLSTKKVSYNKLSSLDGKPVPVHRFHLFGLWKNEEALDRARAQFDRIYGD